MNVKELRRLLKDLPDDMEIILQKDAEGNGYSPLEGGDKNCIYTPDSTWAEDAGYTENEWEEFKLQEKSLVLYPVN